MSIFSYNGLIYNDHDDAKNDHYHISIGNINNNVVAIGSLKNNRVEIYDIETNAWTTKKEFPFCFTQLVLKTGIQSC